MVQMFRKLTSAAVAVMIAASAVPAFAGSDVTEDAEISLQSLLPLEEVEAELDLSAMMPIALKNIKVSEVLDMLVTADTGEPIELASDAVTVWERDVNEEGSWEREAWNVYGMDDYINLQTRYASNAWGMELIVGSGKQLDPNNVRYIVNIEMPDPDMTYNFSLYTQEEIEGEVVRTEVVDDPMRSTMRYTNEDGSYTYSPLLRLEIPSNYSEEADYYMDMALNEELYPGWTISGVYKGMYETPEDAAAAAEENSDIDITSLITQNDMSVADAGYMKKWALWSEMEELTVVMTDGETTTSESFALIAAPRNDNVYVNGIRDPENPEDFIDSSTIYDSEYTDDNRYIQHETYMLEPGYRADAEYYFTLEAYNGVTDEYDSSFITKAVVGHYDSLEAAEDQPDIKDMLFADVYEEGWTGAYKDNFSGEGVDFTVFSENEYWQFTITVKEFEEEEEEEELDEAPNIGSNDRYFEVEALLDENGERLENADGEYCGIYVLPYEHDTYYSNGYQTLFINDTDVDMTKLSPEVDLGDNVKVYHEGVLEETEERYGNVLSPQDFTQPSSDKTREPDNTVKYTVSAENHIDQKNYYVTAVKKEEGPKLYVNGPDEREIFLDDAYDNIHDIFIANIGTEELTGINVTLDATNVKLDDYWTVGGDGNDTLAPFTDVYSDSYYGELNNVAKIRLVPDGEGDINGTLTISADGQEDRVITLKGRAGNPRIDTESLNEAVKYVPYQSIITTNNVHDWNKVSFSLEDGELPEGVELFPSGELYGVPTETGEFDIRVRADYSYSAFDPSYADLTLTVLNNTDENVEAQTDEGFGITTRVPVDADGENDEIFEFEYDYGEHADEFQGFWLDGEKLEEGVDYLVEAGSTKITIRAQTIKSAGSGRHTIAAEYRQTSTNTVKKAAQNYGRSRTTGGGGGGGGTVTPSSYKVWFETNGGAYIGSKTVTRNATVGELPTPERAGYVFDGWYTDKEFKNIYSGDTKVTATTTLYAKWLKECNIWLETNGGAWLSEIKAKEGDVVSDIPTPERAGYVFDGWYTDEALTVAYEPAPLTDTVVLYAKWIEDTAPESAAGFRDVEETAWYFDDISWAYDGGLMVGTSNLTFEPDGIVTGGMVVTVLGRLAEVSVEQYEANVYEDIFEGEWYTSYAKWAKTEGLVDGIRFDPPGQISREDMCVILSKFIEYIDPDHEYDTENIVFADEGEITETAIEPLKKLYSIDVLRGRGNNVIDPKSNTTRAEFAALIHRAADFIENN